MSKQIYTYNNCEPVSGTKGSNTQNSLDVTLHGGGEGKTRGKPSMTKNGKLSKGFKTGKVKF